MPTTGSLFFGNIRLGNPDSQWDVLTATSQPQDVSLSWPAAGGSPSSYEVSVDGVVSDVGNVTTYTATGLTIGQSKQFKVRPVYADGSTGGWSYFKNGSALGFNIASGGDNEYDVSNWNSTGHTYRVHEFLNSGSLNVTRASTEVEVLLVGGGGGGAGQWGNNAQGFVGGSGGSGGVIWSGHSGTVAISTGSETITVGNGGGGGSNGGNGGSSTAFGLTAVGGGGGRQGGGASGGSGGSSSWANGTSGVGGGTPYQGHNGEGGATQGGVKRGGGAGNYEASTAFTNAGRTVTITGSNLTVGGSQAGQYGSGGWGRGWNSGGDAGRKGIVIVAYRIS